MTSGHRDFTKDSISADPSLREVASLSTPGQMEIHHHTYIQTRPLSNPAIPSIYRYKSFVLLSGVGGIKGRVWHRPGEEEGKSGPKFSAFFHCCTSPRFFYSFNRSPKISLETQRVWA